jgi:hypothetical protein
MLRVDAYRLKAVRAIAVMPDTVENVFDIRADRPVVRSASDDDVCLIDRSDPLQDETLASPVGTVFILRRSGNVAKDFAVAGRGARIQHDRCGPAGALASMAMAGNWSSGIGSGHFRCSGTASNRKKYPSV